MSPVYKALAGAGVFLNSTGAAFNGFAAAQTGSTGLAVLCLVNLLFAVFLILLFPWDAK
jgi:hypothetical protein